MTMRNDVYRVAKRYVPTDGSSMLVQPPSAGDGFFAVSATLTSGSDSTTGFLLVRPLIV